MDSVNILVLEKRLKSEKNEILASEQKQKEFLQSLETTVQLVAESKFDIENEGVCEEDEKRLRELLVKFSKMHGLKQATRERAKALLRDLNRPIEDERGRLDEGIIVGGAGPRY